MATKSTSKARNGGEDSRATAYHGDSSGPGLRTTDGESRDLPGHHNPPDVLPARPVPATVEQVRFESFKTPRSDEGFEPRTQRKQGAGRGKQAKGDAAYGPDQASRKR
ncbi:MAG: hypothetical protein ACOZNI_36470 [Myxococcota bacterium]